MRCGVGFVLPHPCRRSRRTRPGMEPSWLLPPDWRFVQPLSGTWFYIDEWVYIFGYIRIAFADVPRDLGLFIVGTLAYRHQWVTRFPSREGGSGLRSDLSLRVSGTRTSYG